MHFIYALLGPLCAFAVVQAIPSFVSQLLAAAVTSHGSSAVPSAVSTTAAAATAGQGGSAGQALAPVAAAAGSMHFMPSQSMGRTAMSEALGVRPGEGDPT